MLSKLIVAAVNGRGYGEAGVGTGEELGLLQCPGVRCGGVDKSVSGEGQEMRLWKQGKQDG